MKKKSIVFFVFVFAVSATIGYFVVKWTKPNAPEPKPEPEPPIVQPAPITNSDQDTTIKSVVIKTDTFIQVSGQKQKPVRKLSTGELTRIINNLNSQNYPRNVTLRYNNLDVEGGEEYQGSISNVRNYIRSKVWNSVTVTDVSYDEATGRVTSITMTINRKSKTENDENDEKESL